MPAGQVDTRPRRRPHARCESRIAGPAGMPPRLDVSDQVLAGAGRPTSRPSTSITITVADPEYRQVGESAGSLTQPRTPPRLAQSIVVGLGNRELTAVFTSSERVRHDDRADRRETARFQREDGQQWRCESIWSGWSLRYLRPGPRHSCSPRWAIVRSGVAIWLFAMAARVRSENSVHPASGSPANSSFRSRSPDRSMREPSPAYPERSCL